jgi:hypothetical protein|tara:strand:- start:46 stop:273 length:228 start_codon:yes stop_codon:yes gene_type:complete
MDVTVYLDKGDALREEGFFESKVGNLGKRIKALEWSNAELVKMNEELRERVTKLATRSSNRSFPPRRNNNFKKRD